MKYVVWRLDSKQERRFRSGHPWVYSNELQGGPKGVEVGGPVQLCRSDGSFLAWGYGNPQSLISFRALSRDSGFEFDREGLGRLLETALKYRLRLGFGRASFRLCFGEADSLPGLVVDAFRLESSTSASLSPRWVLVLQSHTAGIDRLLPVILEGLRWAWDRLSVAHPELGQSGAVVPVVVRRDLGVRKLEGVESMAPMYLPNLGREDSQGTADQGVVPELTQTVIQTQTGLRMECDLWSGQKTGYFLDQGWNIGLVNRLCQQLTAPAGERLKVLDLFCHLGQWGSAIARELLNKYSVDVVFSDASAAALEGALANLQRNAKGAASRAVPLDLIEQLDQEKGKQLIPEGEYDFVICDPPALIKGRKALGPGSHAYLKINEAAIRRLKPDGLLVTCSCSSLLSEEDFEGILSKAARRAGVEMRWILRSGHGADHPISHAFPEGKYLKAWYGIRVDQGATVATSGKEI